MKVFILLLIVFIVSIVIVLSASSSKKKKVTHAKILEENALEEALAEYDSNNKANTEVQINTDDKAKSAPRSRAVIKLSGDVKKSSGGGVVVTSELKNDFVKTLSNMEAGKNENKTEVKPSEAVKGKNSDTKPAAKSTPAKKNAKEKAAEFQPGELPDFSYDDDFDKL